MTRALEHNLPSAHTHASPPLFLCLFLYKHFTLLRIIKFLSTFTLILNSNVNIEILFYLNTKINVKFDSLSQFLWKYRLIPAFITEEHLWTNFCEVYFHPSWRKKFYYLLSPSHFIIAVLKTNLSYVFSITSCGNWLKIAIFLDISTLVSQNYEAIEKRKRNDDSFLPRIISKTMFISSVT